MQTTKVISHIVNWIKTYANNYKIKGYVIGISGGIDSAVCSTLAAKTGIPVICVEMPIHQENSQINRGKKHIEWLQNNFSNISSISINLTNLFDNFSQLHPSNSTNVDLALANTRAILRMTTLYYLAALNNYIVLGTGNKVEDFGVGFYTKYGDGGVDISPIADLLKSEVYKIAHNLNINPEIIKAPPTDGLWGDNKTDEEQIGATYSELEWAMEFKGNINNLTSRQKEALNIFKTLNKVNQHKMIDIPVCKIPENLK